MPCNKFKLLLGFKNDWWTFAICSLVVVLDRFKKETKTTGQKNGLGNIQYLCTRIRFGYLPSDSHSLSLIRRISRCKGILASDKQIKEEVGDVESFGLIPSGSMQTINSNGIETGSAIFEMTVNGSKINRDLVIELKKEPESPWTVTAVK